MSDYYVCSDNIDGKENSRIESLVSALKKAGHNATNGGVGPNTIQSHGMSSASNGQIGVFICGGVDIQVFWDFVQGIGSYYHYKRFIYVYASDTATSDKWLTCNGAKNTPTVQAWDDNYSGGQGDAIGKTVDAYCNEHKDKIWYACGPLGCSFDDVIQNFLNGEGAGSGDTSESSSSSTIKSAICDVMYNWDGEAELFIRDETVHIRKIPSPSKATLSLVEGDNVHLGSINITDYNPSVVNYLTTTFDDYELIIQDELRVKRFGKVPSEVTVEEDIKTLEEAKEFLQREWNKLQRDNDHLIEVSVRGHPKWQVGKWCRVYFPSFKIDDYMYIINMSQEDSATDNWKCNLTLADYPPSFGEPSNSSGEDTTESITESEDNVVDDANTTSEEGSS